MTGASITLPDVQVTAPGPTLVSPSPAGYSRKLLKIQFKLGQGSFGQSGKFDTVTLTNIRASAQFANNTSPMGATDCHVRIWGMTLDQMNQLSKAGLQYAYRGNTMTVWADDGTAGEFMVFTGPINTANPEFADMPDTRFYVYALSSYGLQMQPQTPTSYPGGVAAKQVFSDICQKFGLSYVDGGVTAVINRPYLWGTAWQQLQSLARAANCFIFFNSINNTVFGWPRNATTSPLTTSPVLISPQTGQIGYPEFAQTSVYVRCLYSQNLSACVPGTLVQIQSQLQAASGKFQVFSAQLNLSSRLPKGPWEVVLGCAPIQQST